jgi:hypothetical protein
MGIFRRKMEKLSSVWKVVCSQSLALPIFHLLVLRINSSESGYDLGSLPSFWKAIWKNIKLKPLIPPAHSGASPCKNEATKTTSLFKG